MKRSPWPWRPSRAIVLLAALIFAGTPLPAADASENRDAIVEAGFINDHAPYPLSHVPTIVETSQGELVAAWYGGPAEAHPDVVIWVSRRIDGRWSPAVEVANGIQHSAQRYAAWAPVLFQVPGGPLLLFYKVGPSPQTWWGMLTTSADGGKTWDEPRRLPEGVLGPSKNKPVLLADGSLLCPSSTQTPDAGWRVHFARTTDLGRTWELFDVPPGEPAISAIQPSVLFHRDGRLQALTRTRNGVIGQTWSSDNGRTWSPLTISGLPNPNSGIDAVTLADGRQLLVYNPTAPRPEGGGALRYPLTVALSTDGRQWKQVLTLEAEPRQNGYSYPAVIQSADGQVHVVYTWGREKIKHVVLDPAKL